MLTIFRKELNLFFSSLIGYLVIGLFILVIGLFLFVFPDTSMLANNYATLAPFFDMSPTILVFLIPAVTMRSFSEEYQEGTLELLATRPVTDWDIVLGKFLASFLLVLFALVPSLLYFYTVYALGAPVGNLDIGGTIGSYIGLIFLVAAWVALGIWSSSLSQNQIVAFLLATFAGFVLYYGFDFLSEIPGIAGPWETSIQKLGMAFHYDSISRGLIDSRDVLYFISVSFIFLLLARLQMENRKR